MSFDADDIDCDFADKLDPKPPRTESSRQPLDRIIMWSSQLKSFLLAVALLSPQALAGLTPGVSKCKGYTARDVQKHDSGLTADLELVGEGCEIYGKDLRKLRLEVNYENGKCFL